MFSFRGRFSCNHRLVESHKPHVPNWSGKSDELCHFNTCHFTFYSIYVYFYWWHPSAFSISWGLFYLYWIFFTVNHSILNSISICNNCYIKGTTSPWLWLIWMFIPIFSNSRKTWVLNARSLERVGPKNSYLYLSVKYCTSFGAVIVLRMCLMELQRIIRLYLSYVSHSIQLKKKKNST